MANGPSEMPEKFAFFAEPPAAIPDKDATTQWPFLVATSRIETVPRNLVFPPEGGGRAML